MKSVKTVILTIILSAITVAAFAAPSNDVTLDIHFTTDNPEHALMAVLDIGWPASFTNDLEIYAVDEKSGGWQVISDKLSTVGATNMTWIDTGSIHRQRYYFINVITSDPVIIDVPDNPNDQNTGYNDSSFDPDGDKLTTLMEETFGTNPNSAADNNGNGIPDDWELYYSMTGGADEDPDGDGFTNAEEFYYNTNPSLNLLAEFGIVLYTDQEYYNDSYSYSVADPSAIGSGDNCLQMWIKNNYHYKPTYRFGSENTVINKTGEFIKFDIRADRLVDSNYALQLQLIWSSDVATMDVMPHLYADTKCTIPVSTINTEYVTALIPIPVELKKFRDFRLTYDTTKGSVQQAMFYVDNIAVLNGKGTIVESAEVLDSKHVMITCDQKFNIYSARDLNSHELTDYAGRPVDVKNVGLRSWVTAFEDDTPIVKHYLYLELADDESLVPGYTYNYTCHARNEWLLEPDSKSISFSYNDQTDVSSSIKINQVGYLPNSLKYCYVGNYLGDAGEMPVRATSANLKNIYGQTVGVYPLVKRTEEDLFHVSGDELKPFCGEEVWVADFSAYTTPGKYYLQVPGMGCSYEFEIANDVYNPVYYHTARSFYYQRSGTPIEEQYAGKWSRPASHTAPAYYHNSVADKSGALYNAAIEPAIGAPIDVSGGWYDAADYNKYTQSGADAVNYILSLFELAPEKYTCDALNIPESGNGIPDIIDQAKWELDWLAKMVSANGAVFNKCSFPDFAQVMPQDRTKDMWVITKTTRDTALACAVLAKASRIFRANGWYAADAAKYAQKAQLAWSCLQAHPQSYPLMPEGESYDPLQNPDGNNAGIPDIHTGPYYQRESDANDHEERIWAALEMYKMTGLQAHLNTFESLVDEVSGNPFADDLERLLVSDWYSAPCNIMALYPAMNLNSENTQVFHDAIDRIMNAYQKGLDTWRYQTAMKNTLTSSNFGGLSMSSRWSIYYILFYELVGDPEMLTLAKQNLDFQLGANPLSTTYITGIGEKYPKHPHAKITEYDGIDEVIPGMSVYGVAHSLPNKGYYTIIMDNAYPLYQGSDPAFQYYPTARKFVDAFEPVKMGEFVIDNLARTAMSFGYFSDASKSYNP